MDMCPFVFFRDTVAKTPNKTVQSFSESASAVCQRVKRGARVEIAPLSV